MSINQAKLRSEAEWYRSRMVESEDFSLDIREFTGTRAFLCHSHKDKELVGNLITVFEANGLELYVDWRDHTMPEIPNTETALRIKSEILSEYLFLFLATDNSMESLWCPWEIGIADSSARNIYIIPTDDEHGHYGNEYLKLYPRIDDAKLTESRRSSYNIFQPFTNKGVAISELSTY